MFYSLIVLIYYSHHLLLLVSASPLLFTLNDVRYSLSDRVLSIPKLGSIRGIHIDYENNYSLKYNLVNTEAFLGIQYGLYHGRFEPSKERFNIHPSTKVTKQIEFGSACPQYLWKNASELSRIRPKYFAEEYYPKLLKYISRQNEGQCLYMNIYQPQIKNLKERLPVLLFVHGDGYDMGTGAAFDGAILASYTRTIVVTINYRLGPFGFLYVSREHKGDYALQDIYTALHWLKNYVTNFNGDPDRITLYGTGTGAVLASLVVMLETVNGGTGAVKRRKSLVHRLILNDQTFLSPHMTSTLQEISSYQTNLLSQLSCSTTQCLRNQTLITTNDLLQLNSYEDFNYICPLENPFPFYYSPIVSNDYTNPLRSRFFQQSQTLLPENLRILLTTSQSTLPLKLEKKPSDINNTIEYLLNYAYTKWNKKMKQVDFDEQLLHYHQQIIAPLLQYANYLSDQTRIHVLEQHSRKYHSELPLTLGYVLAPSMSVYNDTYLTANENDRMESMRMMDLFANLIHNGDISRRSAYGRELKEEQHDEWHPVFPDLNFLLLKDGKLAQQSGYYAQVHYLFNNLIPNLSKRPPHFDLINTWISLYKISHQQNLSTQHSPTVRTSFLSRSIYSETKHPKFVFAITFCVFLMLLINFILCATLTKRGRCLRKREYNCLNGHAQLDIGKAQQQLHGGSSPSSTNSNGTLIQQLVVNTNCTTTTNSSLSSTPPVDILHPINVMKKNGILRSSTKYKPPILSEAIV
ncbi:unnamed protein product [Adineta ricciae]|uniref:Carboxylesterase type B domain-containing protein n=2 Tax=Adineta ricciae TaxID=249248 RepID=A0A814K798_ADIRI|nr:unnamed protein product [Adineta ricciae]